MRKNSFFILASLVVILGIIIARGTAAGNVPQETFPEFSDSCPAALELYQLKNPYIGDASGNSRILNSLWGEEAPAPFHMELETRETPYVLRVIFEEMPEEPARLDSWMSGQGLLILALIENADEVQWAYPLEMGGEPEVSRARVTREDLYAALDVTPEAFLLTPEVIDRLLAMEEPY